MAWNNAGTGSSLPIAELNYTSEKDDGSVNIDKAVDLMRPLEIIFQFWSYCRARFNACTSEFNSSAFSHQSLYGVSAT